MPVTIYTADDSRVEIAWLCGDDWNLPAQVSALEAWLAQNSAALTNARYVADIGFSVRSDATGGGAAISPQMMRSMSDLGITLFLSEYPATQDAREHSRPKP